MSGGGGRLNDPEWLQAANGWAAIFWAANFPVVIALYAFLPAAWQAVSILYLALVSIYANFAGNLSAWQSARVEVKQARAEVSHAPRSFPDKMPPPAA